MIVSARVGDAARGAAGRLVPAVSSEPNPRSQPGAARFRAFLFCDQVRPRKSTGNRALSVRLCGTFVVQFAGFDSVGFKRADIVHRIDMAVVIPVLGRREHAREMQNLPHRSRRGNVVCDACGRTDAPATAAPAASAPAQGRKKRVAVFDFDYATVQTLLRSGFRHQCRCGQRNRGLDREVPGAGWHLLGHRAQGDGQDPGRAEFFQQRSRQSQLQQPSWASCWAWTPSSSAA